MIQGIIFSVPGSISPSAPSYDSRKYDGAASGFQSGKHQKNREMCQYFENHENLARSEKVKVRTLIVQLYNYWGPDLYHLVARWLLRSASSE